MGLQLASARTVNRAESLKRGATFKVDYLLYCTIILALLVAIVLAVRLPGHRRPDRQMKLAERARKRREREEHRGKQQANPDPHRHAVLQRQLKNVPTPWGWRGSSDRSATLQNHAMLSPGIRISSGNLQRWVDRLVAEKRTVEDREYRENRHAALRSMIEDRFGRAPRPQEMAYQNVQPPRLMDPQRPHDQMDNFPGGKTEQIVSGLSRQPHSTQTGSDAPAARRKAQLGDIKTPWGW